MRALGLALGLGFYEAQSYYIIAGTFWLLITVENGWIGFSCDILCILVLTSVFLVCPSIVSAGV